VDALNQYQGNNVWEDVILKFYDLINWGRTGEWNEGASYLMGEAIVMADGSLALYDEATRRWVEDRFP